MLSACYSDMEAFYENSQAFFKFLQDQGLDDLLRKTKLRLREKHVIVPHVSAECILFRYPFNFGYKLAYPCTLERITNCITPVS